MALCYIAVACNGTRDQVYGIFPTREAAFECLKREIPPDEDVPSTPTTVEELNNDARIVEIKDGGEEIYIEIHEW